MVDLIGVTFPCYLIEIGYASNLYFHFGIRENFVDKCRKSPVFFKDIKFLSNFSQSGQKRPAAANEYQEAKKGDTNTDSNSE